MPDPELSERLWAEKRPLAFIRSPTCPEANSHVKREMRIFGDRGDLLKKRIVTHSGLRSLSFFSLKLPKRGPATAAESRNRAKVGGQRITGAVFQSWARLTIVIIVIRG